MSKKKRRRSAFPEDHAARMPPPPTETILADDPSPGIFGFFRSVGVRETVESLVIAIVLALLFRAYEAEAFIIPTGSMAPSLNGQHVDLACESCGFQYHTGASDEATAKRDAAGRLLTGGFVSHTTCPVCMYETELKRFNAATELNNPNHQSNNGDRILVNKFIYDFTEPKRYDVIVFKNPNNGKQNYIKRLIGLPGDNILIENGDIYVMEPGEGGWTKEITRKPHRKLRHVLQTVDDTHHIGSKLTTVDWPSRWQSFSDGSIWDQKEVDSHPTFSSSGAGERWLRYRHFQPRKSEWATIEGGSLPTRFREELPKGELIGDKYSYNDMRHKGGDRGPANLGLHWVGDIGMECWLDVKSSKGEVLFDVVEGGAHFICSVDLTSGIATLQVDDSRVDTKVTFKDAEGKPVASPSAVTNLSGAGTYHIEYVNADDQIHLWINNRYIEFDAATYVRTGIPIPTYSSVDAGDAEPLGIGVVGADLTVQRMKVVRDIYYTSVKGAVGNDAMQNEMQWNQGEVLELQRDPTRWSSQLAQDLFTAKKGATQPMFELVDAEDSAKDQFLPMGDNSPRSSDGRVWNGPNFVERDLLIGRALFVYWPHTLNEPTPYFPNFGEMGFIR